MYSSRLPRWPDRDKVPPVSDYYRIGQYIGPVYGSCSLHGSFIRQDGVYECPGCQQEKAND